MDADVDKLITGWFERACDKQLTHDECGARLNRWHYRLGVPVIILATAVAGAIFYWLGRPQQMSDPIKMGIGIASGLAALLACLQTFLGLSQRADQHKLARDRYDALRRSLEILKTFSPTDDDELRHAVIDIQRQMDRLAETSPAVPAHWRRRIDKKVEQQREKRSVQLIRVAHEEEQRARTAGPRVRHGAGVVADANGEDASDQKLEEHVAA